MTIRLEQLRFYGYHGLYVHEKKLGAWFELDVVLDWPEPAGPINYLHETINYVSVYHLIRERMDQPADLLETLAMQLAGDLKAHFPVIGSVEVRITKMNPPLLHFQGRVTVEYVKKF